MLRAVGALTFAFVTAANTAKLGNAEPLSQATDARPAAITDNPQATYRAAVFVTLPMTNGFADATNDLVEAQGFVHEALGALDTVRLVDRSQDSDAVLTVLGRGTGHLELTAALNGLARNVVAPPVMIRATERYIEAMLTVGSCGEAATNAFVGVGFSDRNVRQGVTRPASNSWKACADALARDVEAWVTQNAGRLLVFRGVS
jgi:hypothetical protein